MGLSLSRKYGTSATCLSDEHSPGFLDEVDGEFDSLQSQLDSLAMQGSGWVIVRDVDVPGGEVASKVFQDPVSETVLLSAVVSAVSVELDIAAAYPVVDIGGVLFTLSPSGSNYAGTIAVTLPGSGPLIVKCILPDSQPGSQVSVELTVVEPPVILTLEFTGGYPGAQTELKEDDAFGLTGTLDKPANAIEVLDFGACKSAVIAVSGTVFSISGTIADRGTSVQSLAARCRARDPLTGAYGPSRDTDYDGGSVDGKDLVKLNNLHPTASFGSVDYPGTQQALKGSELASVSVTIANADSVLFDSPNSQLDITDPTVIESLKTVERIAGDYNVSTPNIRATANRTANNATTVSSAVVAIANVAATVTVTEPAARLRSGGNNGTSAQNHTISIVSDQQFLSAPSMDADTGGGTFLDSWAGGPSTWTRSLQVHDNDTKGTYHWQNLSAYNLAGIETTAITGDDSYVLGGFVARSLTFAAFSQSTALNVAVIDYSKLSAGIFTSTNQPAVRHAPQGDHANATNEYTIDSPLGVNPQTLWWNDATAAAANSSGTAQITLVQEAV